MERRAFVGALTGGLLTAPLAAEEVCSRPPVRVVPFPASGTLPTWHEHCAGTLRSFDSRNVASRMLRPLAPIYIAMRCRGSSEPEQFSVALSPRPR